MLYLLHHCRGLAAILVVLFHIHSSFNTYGIETTITQLFNYGGSIGVQFFFALSGFIIVYVHHQDIHQPKKLKPFLLKRFVRIYPIYIVTTLAILPAWFYFGGRALSDATTWYDLLGSLLLLPQKEYPLVVSWTLTHEILFYCLFAILIFNRLLGISLFILWGLFILFIKNDHTVLLLDFLANDINLMFFAGLLAAYLCLRYTLNIVSSLSLLGIAIAGYSYLLWAMSTQTITAWQPMTQSVVYAVCLMLAAKHPTINQYCKKNNLLNLLGDASYSIYLIHFPVISVLNKLINYANIDTSTIYSLNIRFILTTIVCLMSGIVLHILIEKPLIAKVNRNIHR